MVIKEALEIGRGLLSKNNIDEREARLLLSLAMNIDFSKLITKGTCTDEEYARCLDLVDKRISGEPYAYLARI